MVEAAFFAGESSAQNRKAGTRSRRTVHRLSLPPPGKGGSNRAAGDKPPPYGKAVFHAQNSYQTCRGDHRSPVFALCAAGDQWSPLRVCKEVALRFTSAQKSRPDGRLFSTFFFYYRAFTMRSVSDAMTSSSLVGIMKTLTLEVGFEISVAVSGRGRFALCSASNSTPK